MFNLVLLLGTKNEKGQQRNNPNNGRFRFIINHAGCYNLKNVAKIILSNPKSKVLDQIWTNLKDFFQKLPQYVSYRATTRSIHFCPVDSNDERSGFLV